MSPELVEELLALVDVEVGARSAANDGHHEPRSSQIILLPTGASARRGSFDPLLEVEGFQHVATHLSSMAIGGKRVGFEGVRQGGFS